ncbi:putative MATE family efflux protein [Catenibacillus scindens]|uniref:Putative MATE family efflux protein n=1 Tax=Catenibacillus scindens TaxID=673271 RepID=A0A7W8HD81_9FIRM|nr:MATE family efflux transporter [Catenibacillus scindens]MBB5266179.1 putative MATE family efflux protein [Catenibacillus scindens]
MSKIRKNNGGSMDMTTGNPYKLIFVFSIPLLIGNILQQFYNMVDSIVVGNIVGAKALAAVGTGFPVIFMLSSLFMGIGNGATVMVSQFFGAKDFKNLQRTVTTIYKAMLIAIVPLSVVGIIISRPLLTLMQVPDDGTLDMAVTYMIVIFVGLIGSMGYNINAGILQGLGDSRTSLIFLAVATVINVVLDVSFTAVIRMGVFGVALATIIAQLCSWLFGIFYIQRKYSIIKINFRHLEFDRDLFRQALRLGVPSGIQQMCFSIGIMVMQALVNGYGSIFMAGFNGANKIDSFAFMPVQSYSIAVTTYTGQNIGAKLFDRVKKGTNAALVLAVVTCIIIGGILYPFSSQLMRMFSSDPGVLESGVWYLHSVLPFYILLGASFIYSSTLKGAGEMMIPLISSIIGLWVVRVPAAYLLAHFLGKEYIYFSYAIGWLFGFIIPYVAYRRGKWKDKGVIR